MEYSIAVLTASISRSAGGLYDAIRSICLHLNSKSEVYGLLDTYTDRDRVGWGNVHVNTYKVIGFRSFGYAPGLWEELKKEEHQLIHLHGLWMYPHLVSYKWQNKFQKPVLISTHGMLNEWAINNASWKKRLVNIFFASESLKSANCLHALTQEEYQAIRAYGLKNPVAIIPNGISLPKVQPEKNSESSKKTLLYLGRLHPIKGLDLLLDALGILKKADSNFFKYWDLKIVGAGQPGYEETLKNKAEALGLKRDVIFLGPIYDERKNEILGSASAFILPSYSEGLPMSVLEAWSYKLPVLKTKECHIPEGFSENAALALDLDADNIADRLEELSNLTDAQRNQLAENGYRLVQSRFNWNKIAADFEQTYKWLIEGKERPEFVKID